MGNYENMISNEKREWIVYMILKETLNVWLRLKEDDHVHFQIRKWCKMSWTTQNRNWCKSSGTEGVYGDDFWMDFLVVD